MKDCDINDTDISVSLLRELISYGLFFFSWLSARFCRFLAWLALRSWSWGRYVPLELRNLSELHGKLCLPFVLTLVSCTAYSSTLKIEETCSSETSVHFQQTTRRYIPEDRILHKHRCEKLKSYICKLLSDREPVWLQKRNWGGGLFLQNYSKKKEKVL
jgi:hypothetical protein